MKTSRGFTLIEIVIALTILAIIATLVYETFSAVVKAMEVSRESAKELRLRRLLMESFQNNFSSAYDDGKYATSSCLFIGTNGGSGDSSSDAVEFCSSAALVGGQGLPGDLKRVRYEILDDGLNLDSGENTATSLDGADASQSTFPILQLTETPLLASGIGGSDGTTGSTNNETMTDSELVKTSTWTLPVRSFEIKYYDGAQWLDEWNSQEEGRLPWCVQISVNFAKSDAEVEAEKEDGIDPDENPDFQMVVPIPLGEGLSTDGRYDLIPEDSSAGTAAETTG